MADEARETYPELATDHVGMRMLWCTVLEHMINDATTSISDPANSQRRLDIDSARNMIMAQTRDFRIICDFAGYEPDRVHAMVAPRIEVARRNDALTSPVRPTMTPGAGSKLFENAS